MASDPKVLHSPFQPTVASSPASSSGVEGRRGSYQNPLLGGNGVPAPILPGAPGGGSTSSGLVILSGRSQHDPGAPGGLSEVSLLPSGYSNHSIFSGRSSNRESLVDPDRVFSAEFPEM